MTFLEWLQPAAIGWAIGIVIVIAAKVFWNEVQNFRVRNVKGCIIGPEPPRQING